MWLNKHVYAANCLSKKKGQTLFGVDTNTVRPDFPGTEAVVQHAEFRMKETLTKPGSLGKMYYLHPLQLR